MIIGGSKKQVVENIQAAVAAGDLNRKVEEGDAELSLEEELAAVSKFYAAREKAGFRLKHAAMQKMNDAQLKAYDKLITLDGLENLKGLDKTGFIITSNHFNPLDNLCIKKLTREVYGVEPYIVIQATNLAAGGVIGELFNYLDHIPVVKSAKYMRGEFLDRMGEMLGVSNGDRAASNTGVAPRICTPGSGRPVLIYPEEEMWFNYRKPRPNKRGAFHFAAELNVPIVPCFMEILDTTRPDNEEFFESEYIVHVLKPIFPDPAKSVRQNSIEMAAADYEQKVKAYEKTYGKKLDYTFSKNDIANLRH